MSQKVLVVDDDPSIRTTVQLVLEESGFDLEFAASGEKAIEKLRGGFRGLILLDIMMPEMDGWDTLGQILEDGLYEGNVVCMLTAVLDPGPKMERLKEYVLDYVRKPFTPDELVAAIEDAAVFVQ